MIAAGGTGGHVYPALAAAEALLEQAPGAQITFVYSRGDFSADLVESSGLPLSRIDAVRAGPLHGVSLLKRINSIIQMGIGTVQALRLIGQTRPQALLLTGGWVGLPVALAARMRSVPSLIYLPDIEPGLAIRRLTPLASRVALTVADSRAYFPPDKPAVVTGYPIRRAMRQARLEDALAHFGLDAARRTLLVFGGSRGARTINTAVLDHLPDLLALNIQIVHVTGTTDWDDIQTRLLAMRAQHDLSAYHPYAYLHDEMGLAMAAADVCVCRAGASTLGELPAFGLPAVLVPYPYAWRYQKVNADWLADRGAALVMEDGAMAASLLPTIRDLLNDPARLDSMRAAARALAQPEGAASPDGAANLAHELMTLAETRP